MFTQGWPFNAWSPLKGHTYLNKPVAFNLQLKVAGLFKYV